MLEAVAGVLGEYERHLPATARQVFYALVARGVIAKDERSYARLCDYLVRARRARLVPFESIRDDRVTALAQHSYPGVGAFHDETGRRMRDYRRDRQEGQPVRLELWCEAAGMMPQLDRVAREYGVPVWSASGFVSVTGTREIAGRALGLAVPLVILHAGDFDPSGESIFASMAEDAAAFAAADRALATQAVHAERVALTAEQVEEYALPTAPAKRSDSRSRRWAGGTCQLEALPPNLLARVIEDAIRSNLDLDRYEDALGREREDRAELLALPPGGAP